MERHAYRRQPVAAGEPVNGRRWCKKGQVARLTGIEEEAVEPGTVLKEPSYRKQTACLPWNGAAVEVTPPVRSHA